MKTFPIMLNIRGRRAVVVGGGAVGLRKARALAAAGACVKLFDPRIKMVGCPQPARRGGRQTPHTNAIRVFRRQCTRRDLAGAALVFACTDNREVNVRLATLARSAGAMVNAADDPENCDFFMPATVARGDIVVAIGTGGASPALAAQLKRVIDKALPPRVGPFADALAQARRHLKQHVADPPRRMNLMKRLLQDGAYDAFLAGGAKQVLTRLKRMMKG